MTTNFRLPLKEHEHPIRSLRLMNNCAACKNKLHLLFKCDKFKRLDISKRMMKNAKLCYDCLPLYKGKPCNYTNCTICQKHNTLLHLNRHPPATIITEAIEKERWGITRRLAMISPTFTPQLMMTAMIFVHDIEYNLLMSSFAGYVRQFHLRKIG